MVYSFFNLVNTNVFFFFFFWFLFDILLHLLDITARTFVTDNKNQYQRFLSVYLTTTLRGAYKYFCLVRIHACFFVR